MSWPVWYQELEGEEGTCYIPLGRFLPIMRYFRYSGQAWAYRGQLTSYRPNSRLLFKNLDRLGVSGEEDFLRVMGSCLAAGIQPPSSFSSIFRSVSFFPFPRRSLISPFFPMSFGGWQQVFFRGQYEGRVFNYDINKAYRWAACQGLPDVRSWHKTENWDEEFAVYNVILDENVLPYAPQPGLHMVTSEERDFFKIKPREILYGFTFRRKIFLSDLFEKIDHLFPFCRDRICRAFWGIWNSPQQLEHISWPDGKRVGRLEKNFYYNPIWAVFTTSRVKLQLSRYLKYALQVYVDSITTPEELPIGNEIGDFRVLSSHLNLWIRSPGVWGDGDFVIKHSGFAEGESRRLKMVRKGG